MKHWIFTMMLSVFLLAGCGKKESPIALTEDDPAYTLGKELSVVLSILDPDSNRVIVTSKYFDMTAGEVLMRLQANFGNKAVNLKNMEPQKMQSIIRRAVTQLVDEKLLLRASKKARIKIASAEVDSFLNQQYQLAGGEEKLLSGLETNNIAFDFFKESIKNNLTIEKYLNHIIEKESEVPEERIQAAYEKFLKDTLVNVQHILLLTKDKSQKEKKSIRRKMSRILTRARNGEVFGDLAMEFSEDPGSKNRGGHYENIVRGQMVKPFEHACYTVPVGEISDIVETEYGYHIIKVLSRKANDQPLNEVRDELVKKLQGAGSNAIVNDHINSLREKADVNFVAF